MNQILNQSRWSSKTSTLNLIFNCSRFDSIGILKWEIVQRESGRTRWVQPTVSYLELVISRPSSTKELSVNTNAVHPRIDRKIPCLFKLIKRCWGMFKEAVLINFGTRMKPWIPGLDTEKNHHKWQKTTKTKQNAGSIAWCQCFIMSLFSIRN